MYIVYIYIYIFYKERGLNYYCSRRLRPKYSGPLKGFLVHIPFLGDYMIIM